MADHGYDVADPRDVDPVFGDLAGFDALVDRAHEHGLRMIVDIVPNHTSVEHEWFRAALHLGAGQPGTRPLPLPARPRTRTAPSRPTTGPASFGGPAWTRYRRRRPAGEWYLHLFAPEQPDLNWTNPEVWADLEKTMRFWLDRGVDGFRVDVAHGMSKPGASPTPRRPRRPPLRPGAASTTSTG